MENVIGFGLIAGIVAVIVLLFFSLYAVEIDLPADSSNASEAKAEEPAGAEIIIAISDIPEAIKAGEELAVSWNIKIENTEELTITHTGIHYGYQSQSGFLKKFDEKTTPASSGYPSAVGNSLDGEYEPGVFAVIFSPQEKGTVYLRAHAESGGKNYWTKEYQVKVE